LEKAAKNEKKPKKEIQPPLLLVSSVSSHGKEVPT
jgi:hypothetical protein